jgi:acylphosphatase
MRKLTQVDANEIVRLHGIWRNGEDGGVRANFSGYDLSWLDLCNANLSYANLSDADLSDANLFEANLNGVNLRDAIGNGREIITIQTSVYHVNYTSTEIQIGCEKHTIEEWKNFTDEEILKMDGERALNFWKRYKDFIFMAIELSPATPTKH